MVFALSALGGLFLAAFLAATLFPFQSEALLVGLVVQGEIPVFWIVFVASLGNTLGSCVNYVLGLFILRFQNRRWFPFKPEQIARAEAWYHRWGYWSLLLSWAPVIGDPLTLIAGIMRERLWIFVALVALAKTGRYVVLAAIALGVPDHLL